MKPGKMEYYRESNWWIVLWLALVAILVGGFMFWWPLILYSWNYWFS